MRILLCYLSFFLLCQINQSELKAQDSEVFFKLKAEKICRLKEQ